MTIFPTFISLTHLIAMLAAGTCLLAAADGASAKDGVVEVPDALNPDKRPILRVVSATGVQVFTCMRNPAGTTGWILKGPDAQLFDLEDKLPAPVDKAIPWLLLDVKSREGSGAFTRAHAIVRMGTTGGTAPSDGCVEARAGQELRVPYTATYVFMK